MSAKSTLLLISILSKDNGAFRLLPLDYFVLQGSQYDVQRQYICNWSELICSVQQIDDLFPVASRSNKHRFNSRVKTSYLRRNISGAFNSAGPFTHFI